MGFSVCLGSLRVVDPVEDPESFDLARDREVLERVLEGSAVEGLYARRSLLYAPRYYVPGTGGCFL